MPVSGAIASGSGEPRQPDRFYEKHYDSAIRPFQSQFFEIGYRVCGMPENQGETEGADARYIQYELMLINKTGEALKQVRFSVHFPVRMQSVLQSLEWYNEPFALSAFQADDGPWACINSWEALVETGSLKRLRQVSADDFYDMLVEIE